MSNQLADTFQAWLRTQDDLALRTLAIGGEATMHAITMDQVGELMACCFAAGRLSVARELHLAQISDLLASAPIAGAAN